MGEQIYGDVGIKWQMNLTIFGHGGERMIVANHETFMVLGFVRKKGRNICELMGMGIYELKGNLFLN